MELRGLNAATYGVNELAHEQIAEQTDIPRAYYNRMALEAPDLLAANVNRWWHQKPARRMIRTLDAHARCILSNRYRPLDNMDLAEAVLPTLSDRKVRIESAELTERRLYIKAVMPSLELQVPGSRRVGDLVQAGIVISNSEVGCGAVRIEPFAFFLACTNGAIIPDATLRTHHVGKGAEIDGVREMLRDDTKHQDDKAFWMKVRDVVAGSFQEGPFRRLIERFGEATQEKIESLKVEKVVEVATARLGLSEGLRHPILRNLIEGGDLSRYGLMNAVTAVANTTEDYEKATELERAGGKVLELPRAAWTEISRAGAN